ncbi:MAG: M91 family zinc metallopeptidase, partial [Actinomycetota bacterium]|nr:M91 family zinc metallopeptidase [Actinomycetota bacterium]
ASVLAAASGVEGVGESVQQEIRGAQSAVDGILTAPLGTASRQVSASSDEILLSARYVGGTLALFSKAVSIFDEGVDGLNRRWDSRPMTDDPDDVRAREELRETLVREHGILESHLDESASDVAGKLNRGPNSEDIADLGGAGVMPSASLLLDPSLNPPVAVEVDGKFVVLGTDGADHVKVVHNDDGTITVMVGQIDPTTGDVVFREQTLPVGQSNLTIRSGGGDDVIEVPPESRLNITLFAGSGNDLYFGGGHPGASVGGGGDDTLSMGAGDDVVFGGAGDDEIFGGVGVDTIDGQDGNDTIDGGEGYDNVYGGRGDDTLLGGGGNDYLEGGSGDDSLDGGSGDDSLSGGRDDDTIVGGEGDDTMFGGQGTDTYDGGTGVDQAVAEAGETVENSGTITIELTGSPGDDAIELVQPGWMSDQAWDAWLERIDSDLELLRTTPSGRAGLEALDDASRDSDHAWGFWNDEDRHVRILPYGEDNASDGFTVEDWLGGDDLGGNYASPPGGDLADDSLVNAGGMHPSALDERPPVASLYHELAHAYDQISGGTPSGDYTEELIDEETGDVIDSNSAPRAEINSVGVDIDGDGGYDTLETGDGSEHPGEFTENALRNDLGWDNRESYTVVPGDGEDVIVRFEDDNGDMQEITITEEMRAQG